MDEAIYYPDQQEEVQLHDEVKYRVFYLFPWRKAIVTYSPNVSEPREDMIEAGLQCIGITTRKSGTEIAYLIDHENNHTVLGHIKFVRRKDAK